MAEEVSYEAVRPSAVRQESTWPGVYNSVRIGNDQPRAQLNSGWARDNNQLTARPLSYNWTSSCCNLTVRTAGCRCGRTVRRCRNRRITRQQVENRIDSSRVAIPTTEWGSRETVTPRTSRHFTQEVTRMPTQITKHRIEWRDQLALRTRNMARTTFSPLTNLVTNCSCYSPTCGCVGTVGCGCCAPACSCAPTPVQLSTSVTTTPITESYIRRVPVKVPYEERVI